MGTDDLFQKRKKRRIASLRRRRASIAPYDVVLIICEGKKTEPNYFNEFKKAFRLSNANVRVVGHGVDPLSIVNIAIELSKEEEIDRVYCVFDRDRHTTYHKALEKIRHSHLPGRTQIFAIPSIPCFEFWVLLHFVYTTESFSSPSGGSICEEVIKKLKRYLPEYKKGDHDVFHKLSDKMDDAISRASAIEKFHETSGTDNPSTKIHLLVQYLKGLKRENPS